MMDSLRFCIECANFDGARRECVIKTDAPDLVLGGVLTVRKDARYMRSEGAECGPEGKLFEARPLLRAVRV